MKNIFSLFSLIIFISFLSCAQETKIKIWPDGVPGSKNIREYSEETIIDNGGPRILKVTAPELIVFLPPKEKANGSAVIICPGGAYKRLAIDHEGYEVARWFNEMGVAAFVLKYRLPSEYIMSDKTIGPLQDVQESIRIVRRNAGKLNIKPDKIGIMGFSAGGHLAGTASTMYNEIVYQPSDTVSARPDFSILIYGVLSMQAEITHKGSCVNLLDENPSQQTIDKFSNELQVNKQTPIAFLVHASDDNAVSMENSIRYFTSLKLAGVPAEIHIYEKGGHGFGLASGRNSSESTWPEACRKWMKMHGLL